MLSLYDKYFFGNIFTRLSHTHGCEFVICWNNKCTKTAGFCKPDNNTCKINTIELGSEVFIRAIKAMTQRNETELDNGGVKCGDLLKCLQLTFEHELVHALINCFCVKEAINPQAMGDWKGKVNASDGHSKMFMSILNNTFGQTKFRHNLLNSVERVDLFESQLLTGENIKKSLIKGDSVIYTDNEGIVLEATIVKKNPKYPEIKFSNGTIKRVVYHELKKKV